MEENNERKGYYRKFAERDYNSGHRAGESRSGIPEDPERKQERTYDTGGEEKRETGLGRSRCGSACSWYDGVCGGL